MSTLPRVVAVAVVAMLGGGAATAHAHAGAPADGGQAAAPRFRISSRVAVQLKTRPDAEACLVHLHGNEVLARAVMLESAHDAGRGCANAIWLDDARNGLPWGDDRIPLPSATAPTGVCSVNPNRVFTAQGFAARIDHDCDNDAMARAELRRFLDEHLLPALSTCRGGERALPVIAFHNNSNLTAGELDVKTVSVVKERKHDILLVTQADDYARLASLGRFTVALQNAPPADDGSLSVFMQHGRYINVEAQIAPANKPTNRAMAEWALRSVGGFVCGDGDWPAATTTATSDAHTR